MDEKLKLMQEERIPVMCDDCGRQVMAYRKGDTLIITDRRHGENHTVAIPLLTILGTCDNTTFTTE